MRCCWVSAVVLPALLVVEEGLDLLLVADAGALARLLERRLLAEDLEGRPQLLGLVVATLLEAARGVHVEAERRRLAALVEGAVLQLGAPRVAPGEELVKVGRVHLGGLDTGHWQFSFHLLQSKVLPEFFL